MGTDIRLHVEVKIAGRWEHYQQPVVARRYDLFAMMCGVRADDRSPPPIQPEPKGLPLDVSPLTRFDWECDGGGDSGSYLDAAEISILSRRWAEWVREQGLGWEGNDLEHHVLHCYLFGNGFAWFRDAEELRARGVEDLRFVFWFDS